jgi:hypothetical protein
MDQPFVTIHFQRFAAGSSAAGMTLVRRHQFGHGATSEDEYVDYANDASAFGYRIPTSPAAMSIRNQVNLRHLSTFGDAVETGTFWGGRELDETGLSRKLIARASDGGCTVVKGRNVRRFVVDLDGAGTVPGPSVGTFASRLRPRVVWRDVSRPSQPRRLQAALLRPGPVTGNSLGIATHVHDDEDSLFWLLGVFSSVVFESLLRARLATGHVTLSSLKQVPIPSLDERVTGINRHIADCAQALTIAPDDISVALDLEVFVAQAYDIPLPVMLGLLSDHQWYPVGQSEDLSMRLRGALSA